MRKEQACVNCQYWQGHGRQVDEGFGFCVRHAPVPIFIPDSGKVETFFPETHKNEGCGEFSKNEFLY